jgi:plasmid stability protein
MATLTVRNVDEATKRGLRLRAASRGVSMEEEIRGILRDAVNTGSEPGAIRNGEENLYEAIRRLVEPYGGFDLEIPARGPIREPPTFE